MITDATLYYITLFVSSALSIEFSPNVTIVSCSSRKVILEIENAAEGGLVYIQGRSAACSRFTSSTTTTHQFDFETCSIEYDRKFRLVIQRHPRYQTGTDKIIPIMCLMDTSDVSVSTVIFPEEKMDGSLNKTVKPIISMSILNENDSNIVQEVTLDDKVKLNLQLDQQYRGVFDIKASDCSAALIPIVENECSTDDELFPNFVRRAQGQIESTFNAFQPTNLAGDDDADVGFTCTISVCKGICDQSICGEIVGWGRRKRESHSQEHVLENVTVATKLKVKSPSTGGYIESKKSMYCAEKVTVTAVSGIVIVTLVFSWMICGCALCKLRSLGKKMEPGPKMPNSMRRISEINVNFAKSVGRRLSTMLNIPTGYDVKAAGFNDSTHVMDTPLSKRRESVTVRDENMFSLRKRLVNSSTQTNKPFTDNKNEDNFRNENADYVRLFADATLRSTSNPITSISISSAATKGRKSSLKRIHSFPIPNSENISCEPRNEPKRDESTRDPVNNRANDPINDQKKPVVYEDICNAQNSRKSYVGILQVANKPDVRSQLNHDFIGDVTDAETITDDVFELLNVTNTTSEREQSYTQSNVGTTKCFDNAGYNSQADRNSKFSDREQRSSTISQEEKVVNLVRVSVGNEAADKLDFIDDVYEVVEIGAQMKRDRKYSTHV